MKLDLSLIDDFLLALRELPGLGCWGIVAGAGTGSVIHLQLGRKVPRIQPLSNTHLTEDQRKNDAAVALFVECSWRLDAESQVICGAWDDNSESGPMLSGLRQLVDRSILSFELDQPGLDLRLKFQGGLNLRIFCDQVNEADACDNYSLFLERTTFVVGNRSRLAREHRPSP